ncbi:metallophosphoesterase [Xanthobacter sp. KR7-65]|uniref:metallophosphoesterase n=1 Tax=Xanthobacter sp. KR7-65 TaxID=3156612 RepID=UPI0032B32398
MNDLSFSPRAHWRATRVTMQRNLAAAPRPLAERAVKAGLRLAGALLRWRPLEAMLEERAWRPRLETIELRMPGLPAGFDGLRILHVSDTHLGSRHHRLAGRIRDLLDGVSADLVTFTGDANCDALESPPEIGAQWLAHALSGVQAPLGTFAVLGNHDPAGMVEALEAWGIRVLANEHAIVRRGGDAICIAGTDDPHAFWTPGADATLAHAPKDFYRIALIHSAACREAAAREGFQLYLCGHTHGGQICLRPGRPLLALFGTALGFASGVWREGRMIGHTSRGLGTSSLPVRIQCPPAATLIVLRAGPASAGAAAFPMDNPN